VGEQQPVTFRFGEDTEVQYLRDIPALGDYVSHQGALWMVSSVHDDALGALVTCEPRVHTERPTSTREELRSSGTEHSGPAASPSRSTG